MAVSKEHCQLMQSVGEFVERSWQSKGRFIAGDRGYESAFYQGVRSAHPPFPIFMYQLSLMPVLSNGAMINLWGKPDPLCIVMVNSNHSQSRKSRLTGMAENAVGHVDSHVVKRAQVIFEAKAQALKDIAASKRRKTGKDGASAAAASLTAAEETQGQGEAEETPPLGEVDDSKMVIFPGTWSHAFLGGTIERVRERCAGDYSIVRQTKGVMKLPAMGADWLAGSPLADLDPAEKAMATQSGMRGRIWFEQGLVYDEVYQFLQDLSILDKPNEKRGVEGPGARQTPLAGWFNRLVQCGKSDHETKSNGAHGGLDAPTVSTTILGNFHPTPCIEMLRGERGDHGCQAKARIIVCTGLPVQPHEEYRDLDGERCASKWFDVPREIHAPIGLSQAFSSARAFNKFFEVSEDGEEEMEASGGDRPDPQFVPNCGGFVHELPDGVEVHVRMELRQGRYVPQWLLPQRDVDIPQAADIAARAPMLVEHCSQVGPHGVLEMTPEAKGRFQSYSTYYNIQVKKARDDNDPDKGAEFGIGPWKLWMLSGCLFLFDLTWGKLGALYKGIPWVIEESHVERAFELATILDGIRVAFRQNRSLSDPVGLEELEEAICTLGEDRELEGVTTVDNVMGTEIARAIPWKGIRGRREADSGELEIPANKTWALFPAKVVKERKMGKISVHVFREVARACPGVLGRFDEEADALIVKERPVSGEGGQDVAAALADFANCKLDDFVNAVKKNEKESRGTAKGVTRGGKRKRGADDK